MPLHHLRFLVRKDLHGESPNQSRVGKRVGKLHVSGKKKKRRDIYNWEMCDSPFLTLSVKTVIMNTPCLLPLKY